MCACRGVFTPSLWRRRGRVWFRLSEWMSEMSDVFVLFDFVMAPLQRGWVQGFSILNSLILSSSNSCMLRFYPRTWVHFVWNGTGHDCGAECPAAALSEGNARCPNTQTRFGPVRPSSVRLGSARLGSLCVIRRFMGALKVPVVQFDCWGLALASH